MKRLVAGLLVCVFAWCVVSGEVFAGGREKDAGREDTSGLRKLSLAFVSVAKKTTPAVVFIQVEKTINARTAPQQFYNDPSDFFGDEFMERFFGGRPMRPKEQRQFRQVGQGSGFLISKDGYILTNNHVVGDADRITVKMRDGREFLAKRIGSDPKSEVALIKIEGADFPCVEMGDSAQLEVGEWVVAIGNPFGLSETVTAGIVSAKGRSGMGIADYENFIQTDAAINPGNSGGPLINIDGEVVGINTAMYSQNGGYMGIGFAIPINMAKGIKDQLLKSGKVSRGFLGIAIQDVNRDIAESFGLEKTSGILVSEVLKGSPAEKAGVKQGDVILKMDGGGVENASSFRNEVSSAPPGTKVKLTVLRKGKEMEIDATTDTLPEDRRGASDAGGSGESDWGFKATDLTPETAGQLGYEVGEGVLVSEVEDGSVAWRAGIQPGNMVLGVNQTAVKTVKELRESLAKTGKAKTILLLTKAGKNTRYVVLRRE